MVINKSYFIIITLANQFPSLNVNNGRDLKIYYYERSVSLKIASLIMKLVYMRYTIIGVL